MKDNNIIKLDTHTGKYTKIPSEQESNELPPDGPVAVAEISDREVSESPQLSAISPHTADNYQEYTENPFVHESISNDESEDGSMKVGWGAKHQDSLLALDAFEQKLEHPGNPEKRTDEAFVKNLLTAIPENHIGLDLNLARFDDLDQDEMVSTMFCLLRSTKIHDEFSRFLLAYQTDKHTPLYKFLYKRLASDCPYQRKFALLFLPSFIWLLWTRDLNSMGETISILHALYLIEKSVHEEDMPTKLSKDGVDRGHNLFPKTRFPDLSSFKGCIYQHEQNEMQSDDPDVLTDIEIDDLMNKDTRERAGASNFPDMFDTVESLPHCFPLVLVSLRLYVHYINRISMHQPKNPRSLQQLCAVIGRLCNPNAHLPKMEWKWDWEDPSTGKISINAFLPESILNAMLEILRFCLNFPQTKDVAFWALTQFHLYVSTCLLPSLSLQSLCLLEHDFCQNGDRQTKTLEAKQQSTIPLARPKPPARQPSSFQKVQAQMMKKLSSITLGHKKKSDKHPQTQV